MLSPTEAAVMFRILWTRQPTQTSHPFKIDRHYTSPGIADGDAPGPRSHRPAPTSCSWRCPPPSPNNSCKLANPPHYRPSMALPARAWVPSFAAARGHTWRRRHRASRTHQSRAPSCPSTWWSASVIHPTCTHACMHASVCACRLSSGGRKRLHLYSGSASLTHDAPWPIKTSVLLPNMTTACEAVRTSPGACGRRDMETL